MAEVPLLSMIRGDTAKLRATIVPDTAKVLMRWILEIVSLLGVAALATAFLINARRLRRDVNTRFDALRDRLELSANSVIDDLLNTHHVADPDSRGD
jgi:hypothetical protein